MRLKNLAIANGVIGLVGGIVLLFGGWFVLGAAASSVSDLSAMSVVLLVLKVAILVLGIIGIVSFNKRPIITKSPSVLLIIGGAISIIPFMGWIGGIISIVGGSLYLASLKKFNVQENISN